MTNNILPEGWGIKKLLDLCDIKTGKVDANHHSDNGQYPFYTCAIEPLKSETYSFDGDLIILPGNGANVGHVSFYSGKIEAYQRTYVLHNFLANPKLVYFHLLWQWDEQNKYKQFGSATNYIRMSNFEDYSLSLPQAENQQQTLATLFTACTTNIHTIKQRLESLLPLLKTYRQSVLARAVSGQLTAEWRAENGVKLEDWQAVKIGDLGSMFSGKTPSKANKSYWENGTMPWVSAKDMKFDEIHFSEDLITENAVIESKLKICPEDTILMVMRSGIIAHTFPVALTKIKVTINQDLKALLPNKNLVLPRFVFYLLKGNEQEILDKCSKAGTTVASIEMPEFQKFIFKIPSLEEQTQITQAVKKHLDFADNLEAKIKTALASVNLMTQAVLAKGFRGELSFCESEKARNDSQTDLSLIND